MNIKQIIERYNKLKAARDGYWMNVWREVRQYVMPTYSDFLSEGGARGLNIFDTTAIEARSRLAAGMYNWMAPPDKRWFELQAESDELGEDPGIKDYFANCTRILMLAMANSNWASVLIQALNNLACGLDAVVYVEDGGPFSALNFRSFPIETVCYAENANGVVDTVFREFKMTARQLLQEFGDQTPEKIRSEAADPRRQDLQHAVLHAVFPRTVRDKEVADNKNMPVADVYILLESKELLAESGFVESPFAVCRFEKSDNETFGRGPGLNMLPTIKMVNRMQQAYILAREHQADPSWIAPDGSIISEDFNRDPGALNFYKPDIAGTGKPEMIAPNLNINTLFQDIAAVDDTIKRGFFWDIFDPLGDLRQITAREAEIRNAGKMIPFAPIAGNLHSELFRPIIHRVFAIVARRGMLPDPPEALLEDPNYKVDFVSKIAMSIKNQEAANWLNTEATLANAAQMQPEILDNFDLDAVARDVAQVNGANPKWLRDVKERDAMRAARAQQQQAAQAAQQITDAGRALGANLGRKPEAGSPLGEVMGGMGG